MPKNKSFKLKTQDPVVKKVQSQQQKHFIIMLNKHKLSDAGKSTSYKSAFRTQSKAFNFI